MTKSIPVETAEMVAQQYGYDQVVIIARKVGEREHMTTFGTDMPNAAVASRMGEFFKYKLMDWPKNDTDKHAVWQPINTAPRDGIRIIGWNRNLGVRCTTMGKYGKGSPGYEAWEKGDGPLNSGWVWYEPQNCWIGTWEPTHWMRHPGIPSLSDIDGIDK